MTWLYRLHGYLVVKMFRDRLEKGQKDPLWIKVAIWAVRKPIHAKENIRNAIWRLGRLFRR